MPYTFPLLASPHRTVSKAFTLSELAVSMGIIGVISLLTVPGVITFVEEAKAKATLESTLGMVKEVVNNISQNGEYEVAGATANAFATVLANKFKTQKKCLTNALTEGCVTAVMQGASSHAEPGLVLENGAVIWALDSSVDNAVYVDWNGPAVPNATGTNGDTLYLRLNPTSTDQSLTVSSVVYVNRPGEVSPYPGDANALALYNYVMS